MNNNFETKQGYKYMQITERNVWIFKSTVYNWQCKLMLVMLHVVVHSLCQRNKRFSDTNLTWFSNHMYAFQQV